MVRFCFVIVILFFLNFNSQSALASSKETPCQLILSPGALVGSGIGKYLLLDEEEYFKDFEKWAIEDGCQVLKLRVPSDVGIEVRSAWIETQIETWFTKQPKNSKSWVITHSMGGLDWRYLLKKLPSLPIAGVLSMGVPHLGTAYADWIVSIRQKENWLYLVMKNVFRYDLTSLDFVNVARSQVLEKIASRLCQSDLKNEICFSKVRWIYAEVSCQSHCHWTLKFLNFLAGLDYLDENGDEKANTLQSILNGDGIVSIENQKFGEKLGSYELDHLSSVKQGRRGHDVRRRMWLDLRPFLLNTN